jgi:glycosyltransferase involved in cell wall biosynthesis
MRVLILLQFPLYGAGAGNYTRKLAEFLAKRKGTKVAVAAPDERPLPGVKRYQLKLPFRAVFRTHPEWLGAQRMSDLSHKKLALYYASLFRQVIEVVEDFKPDVIHVNHAGMLAWIAEYVKSLYGIGYVVTAHGTDILNATLDPRFISPTKRALQRADGIIAVSYHTRKWLCKVFGGSLRRKTRVFPGGIDLGRQKDTFGPEAIDRKHNLAGKRLVIFVGRLAKEKGVEYLIRAARRIKAEIFILGGGSEKVALEEFAKKSKASNVHFLGYFGKEHARELRGFYKRADVAVVPSIWDEPLGLVVLEAMAQGTPVVASKKGGIPLAVKDGYSGLLVRARSSKAIANAVNRILSDPALKDKLSEGAYKIIAERFDWANLVKNLEKIYVEIIERRFKARMRALPARLEPSDVEREKRELQRKIGHI